MQFDVTEVRLVGVDGVTGVERLADLNPDVRSMPKTQRRLKKLLKRLAIQHGTHLLITPLPKKNRRDTAS
jgi:hypothetical protein